MGQKLVNDIPYLEFTRLVRPMQVKKLIDPSEMQWSVGEYVKNMDNTELDTRSKYENIFNKDL